jgi:hypothetical protein
MISPRPKGGPIMSEQPHAAAALSVPEDTRQITLLLRTEGLAVAVLSVVAYIEWGDSWWLFALLILAPDLAALGYLAGPHIGATTYNIAHCYALPALLATVAILTDDNLTLSLALIWSAHISLDRAIGYGLKYPSGAKRTHLSWRTPRTAA